MISTAAETADSVLVVDDDRAVLRLIEKILTGGGHHCRTAADPDTALRLVDEHRFALAVCDVRLGEASGLELVRKITTIDPEVGVVMVSVEDDPVIASIAAENGAHGYLVKPFTDRQLLIETSNVLLRRNLELKSRAYTEELEKAVEARTEQLERTVAELRVSREETVTRLVRAMDKRDSHTADHIDRVGELAATLAKEIGLDREKTALIRLAAPMHDVGKIGIPDGVLNKPGALDPAERVEMERHTTIGYEILAGSESELLELAAQIALTHHENFDGSGYPNGLSGGDIPLEGRIVKVADVFDALTSDRSYRPAMSPAEALGLIRDGIGTEFDPRIAGALIERLAALTRTFEPNRLRAEGVTP